MRDIASSIIDAIDSGYDNRRAEDDWNRVRSFVSNAVTKHVYTGGNRWMLSAAQIKNSWEDPRFVTFKQCPRLKDADGKAAKVLEGAVAQKILRPMLVSKKVEVSEENIAEVPSEKLIQEGDKYFKLVDFTVFKTLNVFNVSQTTAVLPPHAGLSARQWMDSDFFEKFIKASGVAVFNDTPDKACFNFTKNEIHMPPKEAFPGPGEYYAVLLHEFFHATGHKSRENRKGGDSDELSEYAREELRAELFSTACVRTFGLDYERERQIAYIDHWRKYITENKSSVILKAAADVDRIMKAITDAAEGRQPGLDWFPKVDFEGMPTPLKDIKIDEDRQEAIEHAINAVLLDKSDDPLEVCRAALPAEQFHIMERALAGPNGDYYRHRIEEIAHMLHEMPAMYAQEPYGENATAFLRFSGPNGLEFYLTELGLSEDIAFGYKVDEKGDTSFDEIPLREIRETASRLDADFEPCPVAEIALNHGDDPRDDLRHAEMPQWLMDDYGDPFADDYSLRNLSMSL
jgi:antirestriction protein ArdC